MKSKIEQIKNAEAYMDMEGALLCDVNEVLNLIGGKVDFNLMNSPKAMLIAEEWKSAFHFPNKIGFTAKELADEIRLTPQRIPVEFTYSDELPLVVDKVTVEYVQEGPIAPEVLSVSAENEGGGVFYKISTGGEDGVWSIDTTADITKIMDDFKSRL